MEIDIQRVQLGLTIGFCIFTSVLLIVYWLRIRPLNKAIEEHISSNV